MSESQVYQPSVDEATIAQFANKVRVALRSAGDEVGILHRVEVEIDSADPLQWLAAQEFKEKIYWRDRDGETEIAGVGVADAVFVDTIEHLESAMSHIRGTLHGSETNARYFGGLRFSELYRPADPMWRS